MGRRGRVGCSNPLALLALLAAAACAVTGQGGASGAAGGLGAKARARDQRLGLELRRALAADPRLDGLSLAPYVFLERGFVVGAVASDDQAGEVLAVGGRVGLRSIEGYLPVSRRGAESRTRDAALQMALRSRLAAQSDALASRIAIEVIDGHVVLLGVASSAERATAESEVVAASGVRGMTSFILAPEGGQ